MRPLARRLAAGTVLSLALAGAAPAEPAPATTSVFSPANIAAGLVRGAISYARMVADIRYDGLEIDAARGGLVLRDLQIAGLGRHRNCRVALGRLQVSGLSLWSDAESRLRLDAAELSIANNCFGADAAMIGVVTGGASIPLAALSVDLRQAAGSGALSADIRAISPGIARIEASADFDYVSLFSPDFFEKITAASQADEAGAETDETPQIGLRGTLRAAHLSVENLGVWERLKPLLPPEASSPEALQALLTAEPGSALHQSQQGLVRALRAFMAEPGRVTAEIRPAEPVAFDTTLWAGPEDAATLFRPRFSNGLPTPPVALIADPATHQDNRALGLALAEGRGVPQNSRRAVELLTPLREDAEVALALARLTADTDPALAYGHALRAAAQGVTGAAGVLERIEARLGTADLLAAQEAAETAPPEGSFASTQALRDAALAHERGEGVTRSYALAWRLATLAAAAGDGPAQALMARLEARFGADPIWLRARDRAEELALEDWTRRKLAQRLAEGRP
ncbi:sel1 repeat family protein [Paracoccus sp. P2]|uniref:Sel1 repeat family protein n=1 Tax=Paracoccus pantotrophus TaxID=82367 RepID=A0AAE6NU56_PARPN|nr:sel1 repeat family protein [Paracoccus pantotrophus]MDF3855276.1 sel1 repeat family protein [Paracoccus pantotrophus]QFG36394.1 sel1 repeat family protein [Paracoccus pantotrophus]RDD95181.1 sel1 repeat family protein [Paracoccus pantotrophus]RKS43020.1 hypothetical protein BDE18_3951 [Paracoccus pantotrophus]WGR65859.1 sel1 repeat family protein [Paracoccus pantotrophus]